MNKLGLLLIFIIYLILIPIFALSDLYLYNIYIDTNPPNQLDTDNQVSWTYNGSALSVKINDLKRIRVTDTIPSWLHGNSLWQRKPTFKAGDTITLHGYFNRQNFSNHLRVYVVPERRPLDNYIFDQIIDTPIIEKAWKSDFYLEPSSVNYYLKNRNLKKADFYLVVDPVITMYYPDLIERDNYDTLPITIETDE